MEEPINKIVKMDGGEARPDYVAIQRMAAQLKGAGVSARIVEEYVRTNVARAERFCERLREASDDLD